jgi:hypothetical protein
VTGRGRRRADNTARRRPRLAFSERYGRIETRIVETDKGRGGDDNKHNRGGSKRTTWASKSPSGTEASCCQRWDCTATLEGSVCLEVLAWGRTEVYADSPEHAEEVLGWLREEANEGFGVELGGPALLPQPMHHSFAKMHSE